MATDDDDAFRIKREIWRESERYFTWRSRCLQNIREVGAPDGGDILEDHAADPALTENPISHERPSGCPWTPKPTRIPRPGQNPIKENGGD
jgi:hypothetical protein